MPSVSYRTVEFHRFGESADSLNRGRPYIRTTGWDERAAQLTPTLDQKQVQQALGKLRYPRGAKPSEVNSAQVTLGGEAARFLDGMSPPSARGLQQLDVVTNAGELWTFPFEAAFGQHADWLKDVDNGVVLTRRIRGEFANEATAWPVTPRVLLLHAPIAEDLDQAFIDSHIAAVEAALAPWARGKDVRDPKAELLRVRQVSSVREITDCCKNFTPAYVHVVSHGAPYKTDDDEDEWSLRLRATGTADNSAQEIAEALKAADDPPRVVTFAVCDSGNQGMPIYAARSVVQELHRLGVPVVIGSQLPLTQPGSLLFARAFYKRIFQGDDVRCALHAGRVAVRGSDEAFHDWLSLVAYVRLPPEGYAAYVQEVGLQADLGLLDAAQARADALNQAGGELEEFERVERLVRERLHSVNERRKNLRKELAGEGSGLEASAYKRLAELLFLRGLKHPTRAEADWAESRVVLRTSLETYRAAYDNDLKNHWHGVQQMTLEAVLTGGVKRADDWVIVTRSAENRLAFAARTNDEEYWAHGTLCELTLLGPRVGGVRNLDKAREHARLVVEKATEANDSFPIESTHRQISRYVWWWTNAHGYFPGTSDLSADAAELLNVLVLD